MTSRPTSVKRSSASHIPAVVPSCKIHPSAIIADRAQLTGLCRIEIGENAVVHPYAKLKAEYGNIVLGKGSMVYENAVIQPGGGDIVVGEYVNVETGAQVEAKIIGDGTVVEINAVVGNGAVVGKWCKVCPLERVEAGEELEDFTVVFGHGQRRIDRTLKEHTEVKQARKEAQEKAVEVMRKLIPNAASKWMHVGS